MNINLDESAKFSKNKNVVNKILRHLKLTINFIVENSNKIIHQPAIDHKAIMIISYFDHLSVHCFGTGSGGGISDSSKIALLTACNKESESIFCRKYYFN